MATSEDSKYILEDHNYGKNGVKILHLVRNGNYKRMSKIE